MLDLVIGTDLSLSYPCNMEFSLSLVRQQSKVKTQWITILSCQLIESPPPLLHLMHTFPSHALINMHDQYK